MNRYAVVALGALLAIGWAAVAVGFALPAFTGYPPNNAGDALALGVVGIGVLVLAAISGAGARSVWRDGSPRLLSTGALCTVVVAGWPAITALGGGLDDLLDPVGAGALGLTLVGGATLVVLRQTQLARAAED